LIKLKWPAAISSPLPSNRGLMGLKIACTIVGDVTVISVAVKTGLGAAKPPIARWMRTKHARPVLDC